MVTAAAYFIATGAALLIGSLSDKVVPPLSPAAVVLAAILFTVPPRQWSLHLLFAFAAHALAAINAGQAIAELLIGFGANCVLATTTAAGLRYWIEGAPLNSLRNTVRYILIAVAIAPAFSALAGAFVPIASGENIQRYWRFWAEWYVSNALAFATIGPALLVWIHFRPRSSGFLTRARLAEATLLCGCLLVACHVAFAVHVRTIGEAYLPPVIYLPVPLVALTALRFGNQGASAATFLVTVDLLLHWLGEGGGLVFHVSPTAVFSLQTCLIGLSALMLLLGASADETRNAARLAQESEERMIFAASSAHTGLWEYDIKTATFWSTDFCRELFGLRPKARITARALIAVVHPDDRSTATAALRVDNPSLERSQSEFRVCLPDGATRWIRAEARVYRGEEGKPLRIGGIFSDITRVKLSELESEQRRRDLVHLTRVSILGELSGAIAHEINQPLTAILANAQAARMLLTQSPPKISAAVGALDDVIREDIRASQVISRMRGLLKKGEIKPEPVQLNEIIDQTVKLLHGEFVSKHVDLKTKLDRNLPTICGDPVQLQQVILNVIMNAMEAMRGTPPAKRLITIKTMKIQSGWIGARILDSGPGIATEQESLVKEPFFTTKASGLGLGLSICTTIMRSHGGDLQIGNSPNGGAEVLLTLPTTLPENATAGN